MPGGTLLLVDWGTSSRRAWLVDEDGKRLGSFADDRGMLHVPPGGWPAAYAEIVAAFPGARPRLALLAGMVGADRGWSEAPYASCPAGLAELATRLHWVIAGQVAIVPGLRVDGNQPDVMRGEEVQALGAAAAGLAPSDGLTCHPGTHTKWVRLEQGRITGFRTVMTGEMFALLKAHSILADLLTGGIVPGPAFLAGVDHGWAEADLTAELFRVRARVLLGAAPRGEAAAYTSGLLVGSDLRIGLAGRAEAAVHVVGRGDLSALFCAALAHKRVAAAQVDGEAAVVAGLRWMAERME